MFLGKRDKGRSKAREETEETMKGKPAASGSAKFGRTRYSKTDWEGDPNKKGRDLKGKTRICKRADRVGLEGKCRGRRKGPAYPGKEIGTKKSNLSE